MIIGGGGGCTLWISLGLYRVILWVTWCDTGLFPKGISSNRHIRSALYNTRVLNCWYRRALTRTPVHSEFFSDSQLKDFGVNTLLTLKITAWLSVSRWETLQTIEMVPPPPCFIICWAYSSFLGDLLSNVYIPSLFTFCRVDVRF